MGFVGFYRNWTGESSENLNCSQTGGIIYIKEREEERIVFGALYGDVIGSYYEVHCTKDYDFPLMAESTFTDDSVLIAAVCKIITIISAGKHEEQSILRLPSGKGQNEVMNFSEHSDFYSSPLLIRRQSQYTKSCFNTNGKNQSGTF